MVQCSLLLNNMKNNLARAVFFLYVIKNELKPSKIQVQETINQFILLIQKKKIRVIPCQDDFLKIFLVS